MIYHLLLLLTFVLNQDALNLMMMHFPLNVALCGGYVWKTVKRDIVYVNHVVVLLSCRHHCRRGGRRGACSGQTIAQKAASAMGGCRLPYALQVFFR